MLRNMMEGKEQCPRIASPGARATGRAAAPIPTERIALPQAHSPRGSVSAGEETLLAGVGSARQRSVKSISAPMLGRFPERSYSPGVC